MEQTFHSPLEQIRETIVHAFQTYRAVCICAPAGSGKSTSVPGYLLEHDSTGRIVVLQPRRLAARHLAAFCARTREERVGQTVGYEVRFDSAVSSHTRIVFQTYGFFVRRLLADPRLSDVTAVVFDEFHERTLEADLAIAWLKHFRELSDRAPGIVVMSATLDAHNVTTYLGCPLVTADSRQYPVTISHQSPRPREPMEQQIYRALAGLLEEGLDGSVLIFVPGRSEIHRTAEALSPLCNRARIPVFELHGGLPLSEQMRCVDESSSRPVVIVSTNIAETSITIPGVTAVIDSGYERRMACDPVSSRNMLFRGLISRANAAQRAGRAGRTTPGRCIRLYGPDTERAMAECTVPEIDRLELSRLALDALGLCERGGLPPLRKTLLPWLSPPSEQRWSHALKRLAELQAVENELEMPRLTQRGRELLRWPVGPVAAALMTEAVSSGVALSSCALIALWENQDNRNYRGDLFPSALTLAAEPDCRQFTRDIWETFETLRQNCPELTLAEERDQIRAALRVPSRCTELRRKVCLSWLKVLEKRLAIKTTPGNSYEFADGTRASIEHASSAGQPPAILALEVLTTGGSGQAVRNRITSFLPLEMPWLRDVLGPRIVLSREYVWDEKTRSVGVFEETRLGTLVIDRRRLTSNGNDHRITQILVEKLMAGELPSADENTRQLIRRIQIAGQVFPEKGFRLLDAKDWQVIYQTLASGKWSVAQIDIGALSTAIRSRLGRELCTLLDSLLPTRIRLHSGRTARISYPPDGPPELVARIGDLVGTRGPFTVGQGRIHGVYNILAPNMHTVQKTSDIDGFWEKVYPQIRSELRRKYPKHPWP